MLVAYTWSKFIEQKLSQIVKSTELKSIDYYSTQSKYITTQNTYVSSQARDLSA